MPEIKEQKRSRENEAYIYTTKDRRAKLQRIAQIQGHSMTWMLNQYIDSLEEVT